MNSIKPSDLKKYKTHLADLRRELLDDAKNSEGARKPVELDQTAVGRLSRMDALQVQAMALETERRRNIELKRIASALERIGTDDYGYCATCGEEIALKRLENDPATPLCIDCARTP
jgi:DnaK suppressor protein